MARIKPFALHLPQLRQGFVNHLPQHRRRALAVRGRVRVVHIHHVQPRQAQALQAFLHAAASAGGAEVPHLVERQYVDVAVLRTCGIRVRQQQAAHLAREHIAVPRMPAQRITQAPLRQAMAVMRRGVKGTAAVGPGGINQRPGIGIRDGAEQIAQRRAAQAQPEAASFTRRENRGHAHSRSCHVGFGFRFQG
jgi:hypothetical protein